jgi:5-methylcytosine-specific restriction endonuclease McrA
MKMITKCKWCGGDKLKFIETPNLIHYGKMECKYCGKFCYWIHNPNNPENIRKNKKTSKEVCNFHQINKEICFFCLRTKEQLGIKETLTVDHIQELSRGGLDILENMQVLCSACHKLKNWARLYMNWHLNLKDDKEENGNTKTITK